MWTVCASGVEWVEFEHFPESQNTDTLESQLKQKKQAQLESTVRVDATDITSIETRLSKAIKSRVFKL